MKIYEKVKNSKSFDKRGAVIYSSLYKELGNAVINPDPFRIYQKADEQLEKLETWFRNWKQLKREVSQDVLSKFSKEELEEALNKKQ